MLIIVFVTLIFLYSLVSQRLQRGITTAPILFTLAGMLTALALPDLADIGGHGRAFLTLAEIGLVLLLFSDASRADLNVLRQFGNLPTRLLSVGMLLTIALGAVLALLVFPQLTIWEAGILAAILAPTDAGLGQVIVASPHVPKRIREALNVEAGLNDGLSVPFLLFFIALAASGYGYAASDATLLQFVGEQLGLGVVVGVGIGRIGGALLDLARRRDFIADAFLQFGVVALPILCLLLSERVGASMFIAAFVAGIAVQVMFREVGQHSLEFGENWGQLVNLSVFFLFGLFVARAWPDFDAATLAYAILSLTVVRMVPVAIALIGTRLDAATVLFIGWFGPRGLASIVLGLVYLESTQTLPGEATIRLAVMVTVLISVFAHGLSAAPGIALYARASKADEPEAPSRPE
jgi:sodium/hydrogen antiporter